MVSLDQIRQLEAKVNHAVEIIRVLKEENRSLRRSVDASQVRMKDLEDLVRVFKNDQAEIERGLVSAIRKLDLLEDGLDAAQRPAAAVEAQAAPAPQPASSIEPGPADAIVVGQAGRGLVPDVPEAEGAGRPGQLDIF